MPVFIRTSELQYKDNNGIYHGVNAVGEKKITDMVDEIDEAIANKESQIASDIAAMQNAVNNIDSQRQTMIESIASVAGQGTDTTLTQPGVAADAQATGTRIVYVENCDKLQDSKTNDLLGLVNYWYDEPFSLAPGSSAAANILEIRNKTECYLEGSPTGTYHYLKLNGTGARATSVATAKTWTSDGVSFTPGHRYRIILKTISGTCVDATTGENTTPSIRIYEIGTVTDMTAPIRHDANTVIREFCVGTSPCNVVLVSIVGKVFTNYRCSIVIQDLDMISIKDEIQEKADVIVRTIDGPAETVTITDAQENVPMRVTADFKFTSNSNGYDYPWVGGNGNNIMPTPLIQNYYINSKTGGLSTSANSKYYYTDYIPVTPGQVLYFGQNNSTATTAGLAFYAQDKIYISESGYTWTELANANNVVTVPEGAAFMRHSFNTDQNPDPEGTCYITLNSNPHEWTPYENIGSVAGYYRIHINNIGRNLFNKSNYVYVSGYPSSDTSTIISHVDHTTVYIPCKPNTTYTASKIRARDTDRFAIFYTTELPAVDVAIYDLQSSPNSGTAGEKLSLTITTGANATYLCVRAAWSDAAPKYAIGTLQIEEGSVATEYVDGSRSAYEIELPSDNGDFYGGILTINKDGTGTLRRTYFKSKISNWTWGYTGTYGFRSATSTSSNVHIARRNGGQTTDDAYCTAYKIVNPGTTAAMRETTGITIGNSSFSVYSLIIRDPRFDVYSDEDKVGAFLSEMGDVDIVYKYSSDYIVNFSLSVPQVRSLLNLNKLSCIEGNILSVEYAADPKTWIMESNDTIKDIISASDDIVSKENHLANEVFICGDKLYRATQVIVAGETIAEGTNVATTIAIGNEQVPLNITNYIKSVLVNLNNANSDIDYLKTKITDPDEAASKDLYIQNGQFSYNSRTVTMKDGVVNFVKESGGSAYKSIWLTGPEMIGGSENLANSKPTVDSLEPISKLDGVDEIRVHYDRLTTGAGYLYIAIVYCTTDGETVTVVGNKQSFSSSSNTDYISSLMIPSEATHYAIQAYSSTTTTCAVKAYLRFRKSSVPASATGVSF